MFEKHTTHCTKGNYRLLILDGHGSYITLEFDLFYKEHAIITLYMPPHSLHLLQPLDVNCFLVLKQLYKQQIKTLIQNKVNYINKQDFFEAYHTTYTKTINQSNI